MALVGGFIKFSYQASQLQISDVSLALFNGMPSVLVFACAGRYYNLAQPGLLPTLAPRSISLVPVRLVLWSRLARPHCQLQLFHKLLGASVPQSEPTSPLQICTKIKFFCVLVGIVGQCELAYSLPQHLHTPAGSK